MPNFKISDHMCGKISSRNFGLDIVHVLSSAEEEDQIVWTPVADSCMQWNNTVSCFQNNVLNTC